MSPADLVSPAPDRSNSQGTVAVLVITGDNAVYRRLESIIGHSKWRIHRVRHVDEAETYISNYQTPVVITEDSAWREVLSRLIHVGYPAPRVVVASRMADDPFWQEVLERGGYNVIRTPFDPSEVYWVVSNAWRDWKSACQRTQVAYA
jgi:DNA-binding NtrC family response regulator